MANKSNRYLNLDNPKDQKILKAYVMAVIAANLASIQKYQTQLKTGTFVKQVSKDIDLFQTSSLAEREKFSSNSKHLTNITKQLFEDYTGKDGKTSVLDAFLDDRNKTTFSELSNPTKNIIRISRNMPRKKILSITRDYLNLSKEDADGFRLSNDDIHHIESVLNNSGHSLHLLRATTERRFSSEKRSISKAIAKKAALTFLSLSLAFSAVQVGKDLIEDFNSILSSNNQSFSELVENGFSNTDFDISANTYANLIDITQKLNKYSITQPSLEEQLELSKNMIDTYSSVITEKCSSAFKDMYPDKNITNIFFNDNKITVYFSGEGNEVDSKTFSIKDLPFQNANLQTLVNSITEISSMQEQINTDIENKQNIDNAIQNDLSNVNSSEYDISENTRKRIETLKLMNTNATNACALEFYIRDNLISQDEFMVKGQNNSSKQANSPSEPLSPSSPDNPLNPVESPESTEQGEQIESPETQNRYSLDEISSKDSVIPHFKNVFAEEYNNLTSSNIKASNITISSASQSYAYVVTVGDNKYIMTHGSYPDGVREFLEKEQSKGTLSYEPTRELSIIQIYQDADLYDDNGNHQNTVMIDGVGVYQGKVLPVISGNFHDKCLDENYKSLLVDENIHKAAEAIFNITTPYLTNDYYVGLAKKEYIDALNNYESEKNKSENSQSQNENQSTLNDIDTNER